MVRAVFFDLDGTLVDTAPDLGRALNQMLTRRKRPALDAEAIRPQASHGSEGLIQLAFGVAPGSSEFNDLRREFLGNYAAHMTTDSALFPGVAELLDQLDARGMPWGVVTNKPERFTEPLLNHLGLYKRAACVVSGDRCVRPKPDPEPMRHACRALGITPGEGLCLGDAERDIKSARGVGMPALVALYGYLSETDRPEKWGGDGMIHRPLDLLDYPGLAT